MTGGVCVHHKDFAGYWGLRRYNQGHNFQDHTHAHRGKCSLQNSLPVMKCEPERTVGFSDVSVSWQSWQSEKLSFNYRLNEFKRSHRDMVGVEPHIAISLRKKKKDVLKSP